MTETNETKLVRLKNGHEEAEPLVSAIMLSLQGLLEQGEAIAFYELVMLCRNPQHTVFGDMASNLAQRGLLAMSPKPGTVVHDSVRNIVLSAAVGEGLDLSLVNPVAEPGQEPQRDH